MPWHEYVRLRAARVSKRSRWRRGNDRAGFAPSRSRLASYPNAFARIRALASRACQQAIATAAGKRSGRVRSLTVAARKLPKCLRTNTCACEPRASASDRDGGGETIGQGSLPHGRGSQATQMPSHEYVRLRAARVSKRSRRRRGNDRAGFAPSRSRLVSYPNAFARIRALASRARQQAIATAAGKRSGRVRSLTVAARKLPKCLGTNTCACEPRASASDRDGGGETIGQVRSLTVAARKLPKCLRTNTCACEPRASASDRDGGGETIGQGSLPHGRGS